MNILELQDNLKDVSDDVLMKEMQMPSGNAPQFLVLSELKRRKRMRDEFQRQQAANISTVAEEVVTGAGMPQQGIMQAARAMAPNTNMAQNTGMDMAAPVPATRAPQQPQMMADGGIVTMREGGAISAQPTGQGGTYILMQDGERVPGTGIYPDFRSANEAARALRGSQPFETARILEEPDPVLETEVSELSKVSPDPMAFAANDEIRRQLQLRQARGQRDDAEVGGITSLDPFGRAFMDEYRPDLSEMEGIPSGGEGVQDVMSYMRLNPLDPPLTRDTLPENVREDDLRFSRGTASSNAVNDAVVGGDVTDALGRRLFDERRPTTDRDTIESPTTEEELANALGFAVEADQRNELLERLEQLNAAPPSVLGASSEAGAKAQDSGFLEFLSSLRTPDDENPMVGLVESGIESASNIIDPEFTGREEAPFIRPSKLSGDNFSNDPTKGYSYPTDVPADDPSMEASEVFKRLAEVQGSGLPEGIYGGYDDPEAIARKQQRERMLELEPLGEGMQEDAATTIAEDAKKKADEGQTVTTDDDTTNVKPITDGGEGGAGFGSTDSRIAKMLSERQKEAESDKWMALAYAGMELMKPTATFGEGLGKAGQAGLGYLTKSKKGLRDFETDMLKLETQLEAARLRSQGTGKTSATAYAALERSYSEALELATQNPSAPNLARLKELEDLVREARAVQFGAVTADNTNSGVIKTPSAQT
jgi:hypothetical protein